MSARVTDRVGDGLPVVRPAGRPDLALVARIIADAFDDDPVFRFMARTDARRRDRMLRFFHAAIDHLAIDHGGVEVTDDGSGAAIWLPPGATSTGIVQQLRLLPAMTDMAGIRGVPRVLGALSRLEAHHPHEPHAYLMFLGVAPGQQGRGIGTALLRERLAVNDRTGTPAYLEASSPRNRALYERHGFIARDAVAIADGGPSVWPMWRPATSPHSATAQRPAA